jgi:hypothetical protein
VDGCGSIPGRVQNGSGVHPASYPMDPKALSSRVKRAECEAGHLSLPVPRSKIVELYFHSPIGFHGDASLIKHMDNFTSISSYIYIYIF